MMRLLIWLLLGYIAFRILKNLAAPKAPPQMGEQHRPDEETVQDPVCKVYLSKRDAVIGTLEGERHYFCSMACLEKFREQLDHTPDTHT